MSITKDDFQLWKSEPVTEAFLEACQERIEEAKEILSVEAGMNPEQDNFYRGFIRAYREMLEFRFEE